jgi:hypothetical protein
VRYLVDRMAELEHVLLDAVNQLSEKMDSYDQCLSSLGSDLSKVQSVDLSLSSIQVLQKEQVVMLKSVNPSVTGGSSGSSGLHGLMGASPVEVAPSVATTPRSSSGDTVPAPQHHQLPLPDTHHEHVPNENRRSWMPKMDIPRFDGSDVRIWLDKCSAYFQLYAIPHDFRVTTASLHMVGKASHWFQPYKHSWGSHTWEHFVLAVSKEFEVNTHRVKTMALLNLRQTGSVEEYKQQFDQLVYHIRLYDPSLNETMLTFQFLLGLKEELRQKVEMHLPDTMSQVATLAAIQEHLSDRPKLQQKRFVGFRTEPKPPMADTVLWKARQLKDYIRIHNLCFKCGEKYSPTHTCSTPIGNLNMMENSAADGGGFLSDEVLTTLESHADLMMGEESFISLHAMSGKQQQKAIQLRALVKNQVMVVLIDSGSSHTFLNTEIASRLQVPVTLVKQMMVKVANGATIPCNSEVQNFKWWCQGHFRCTC